MQIKKIIEKFGLPVKEVLIASNLISEADKLVENLGFVDKRILVVTDEIIYPEIAVRIIATINNPNLETLILKNPKADEENLLKIINYSNLPSTQRKIKYHDFDLIIAIGSGTINDLCKLASYRKSIPYIIFGTAPSMNGYLSANASILIDNHKKTLQAWQPIAVYLDLDVGINAPERLIRAGIGDSMCISTCKFDWLMSHLIFKSEYNKTPFELLKSRHKKLINSDYKLRDKNFIKLLYEILVISGIGMYICKGSYPASQGEHLIAHYLEMNYPEIIKKYFHGEQIAVTTLTMAKIQEKILNIEHLQLSYSNLRHSCVSRNLNNWNEIPACAGMTNKYKKIPSSKQIEIINKNLQKNWSKIKRQLLLTFISKEDLLKLYRKFDLPSKPNDIGVKEEIFQEAINNAHLIRNRFTALDILHLQL